MQHRPGCLIRQPGNAVARGLAPAAPTSTRSLAQDLCGSSMPSLHSSTKSRAANSQYSLVLHAQHRLQYGQPLNEPVVRVKSALPAEVDVFLDSNLVITLGATVDHKKIPEDVLEVSGFVRHLKDILADVCSLQPDFG